MSSLPNAIDRSIDTDVLVVGGGGAGAAAAVAAARAGRRVLITVKGQLGKSGSTFLSSAAVAMDGQSARRMGQRRADPWLTKDRWFEQIVRGGFFLSEQPLVRLYVEQAAKRVAELLNWGRRIGQPFLFGAGGSWITTGRAIGLALRYGVKQTPGIERLEDVMVCELVCDGDRVCGAVGIDIYSGELIFIRSRAVVLATGGFQPFSFKCAGGDTTGDGIAMAFRAGAAIADMEFFLFAPGVLLSPRAHRGSILPMFLYGTGQIRPDILAADGTDLMGALSPEIRRLAEDRTWFKLVHAVVWSEALAGGNAASGGGVFFDFRRYSALRYHLGMQLVFLFFKRLYGHRFRYQSRSVRDLFERIRRRGRWEVGLCAEYSLGGVVVEPTMATSVGGLYAAGEVTSGTFGATRTTRALTEMLVQGAAAGKSAADFAGRADRPPCEKDRIEAVCRNMLAFFDRPANSACGAVLQEAETIADAALGVRRSGAALSAGLEKARQLRSERLPQLGAASRRRQYNLEWMQFLQLKNQLLCLEASMRAALARSESRGQHLRLDCPKVDNARWLRRLHLVCRNRQMVMEAKPPVLDRLSPPERDFPGVVDYALDCRRRESRSRR
jgi:succinate dehydrogenase / fumarate reductase flavoprotein subunit